MNARMWRWIGGMVVAVLNGRAAEDPAIAEVLAADAERVAAVIAADRARLEAVLSDDLRYAHANGKVDTKAALMETLLAGRTDYESFEYLERTFRRAGEDAIVMAGRVIVGLTTADGRRKIDLNYLAVWRRESGMWRFLAWQSAERPRPVPEPPPVTSTDRGEGVTTSAPRPLA